MELDPIQQSVLFGWTRACGAAAKGFDVDLAGLSEVLVGEGSLSGSVSEGPGVGTCSGVVGK